MMFRSLLAAALFGAGLSAAAEPLSRKFDIDFFRDVPSRSLKGLAARSDGRLVAGPVLTPLAGDLPADLLWAIEPGGAGRWLLGTGPEGRILEVALDPGAETFTTRTLATLDETQVLALRRLPDGRLLAGTSPHGRLYLLGPDGAVLAQLALPVDSILDFALLDDGAALAATGNPGRLYRLDLQLLAGAGMNPDRIADEAVLAGRGAALLAEIRDRNVRRVVVAGDRILAGSAPRGNLYALPRQAAPGTAPVILQENRDAEITDLLPLPNGDVYAAIVFSGTTAESRVNRPAGERSAPPDPGSVERFPGRSTLMFFPVDGFPETLASRAGTAFYRLAQRGDLILIAGGEQGELMAYSRAERRSMNFAGSEASQLNGLAAADPDGNAFLLVGNNAPQLARLDFNGAGPRSAETRRLDLGSATRLGNLRFNRLRALDPGRLSLSLRASQGTDDVEGWTEWRRAEPRDGAWHATLPPGRYVRVRIEVAAGAAPELEIEIDRGALYHLPQNRRPQLQDFRLIAPNYGLIPRPEQPTPPATTLGQILGVSRTDGTDDRRSNAILSSQVMPQPGAQIAYWNVTDPDGDTLAATFSLRRDGETAWTDLAVAIGDPYVQFDFSHLPDGVYFTRLVVAEQAPRASTERLTATFETDDLVIDRTAPEIVEAGVARAGGRLAVTVRGRDALSLLAGIELAFNNGVKEAVEQPADGILDGREETFVADLPEARTAGATAVEVLLYDAFGNSSSRRLSL